ncbi:MULTISPECIES: ABC transporter ATP-binding protein [unclassified Lentimonas]|uniref:ABC transporter ATP-binding protein n=1 Tax=unclassified Lentimonas TaxID=2630993 RepID=UPI001322AE9D|nr:MULTISPECIES: ABC transporter ATP-binding protein [unclassified Lentimonas]CAA6696880.1 Unannotated [Lentimonas sp. CC10]CAA6696958.1 Unannotated [Lentimonas sp. CC19]CAA7071118.1 Unannotated [Lentimonas sp. CC11]
MPNSDNTPPALSIKGLSLRRGDKTILKDVNWSVLPDEHWAILGANGCGKTSLLAALTGYLSPTTGTMECIGRHYGKSDWSEMRKRIGMVSSSLTRRVPADEPAIETVLSGATAQLGYWTREQSVDPSKALRCLSQLKVRALADRPWGILSQGERQKVFIARSLMARPKLLILDEPCAGLDPVAREQFLESLQTLALRKRGPRLVLVTHHIEEIFPEITHILLLKDGKVLAQGPKSKVLNSENLSQAFGAPLQVRRNHKADRWNLQLKAE